MLYQEKPLQSPKKQIPKSPSKLFCWAIGSLLGPYYRKNLFPARAREPDRNPSPHIKPVPWPPEINIQDRLHVIRYEAPPPATPTPQLNPQQPRKLFIYIHGRARSANRSLHPRRNGTPDTIPALLAFGPVLGVNLPGYEASPLTNNSLRNAELDTLRSARALAILVRAETEALGLGVQDVVVVGVSIGMYMSLVLASHLRGASVVLIVPPADLETVPFSAKGVSLKPLIPWAARRAYPSGLMVGGEGYETAGFDGVEFLRQHGGKIEGQLCVFTAREDTHVPRDAGRRLGDAFAGSRGGAGKVRVEDMRAVGHDARPDVGEWREVLESWALDRDDGEKTPSPRL